MLRIDSGSLTIGMNKRLKEGLTLVESPGSCIMRISASPWMPMERHLLSFFIQLRVASNSTGYAAVTHSEKRTIRPGVYSWNSLDPRFSKMNFSPHGSLRTWSRTISLSILLPVLGLTGCGSTPDPTGKASSTTLESARKSLQEKPVTKGRGKNAAPDANLSARERRALKQQGELPSK
jgi:hypothetical protein